MSDTFVQGLRDVAAGENQVAGAHDVCRRIDPSSDRQRSMPLLLEVALIRSIAQIDVQPGANFCCATVMNELYAMANYGNRAHQDTHDDREYCFDARKDVEVSLKQVRNFDASEN